jgi:osmotically-inducible protein OsmY
MKTNNSLKVLTLLLCVGTLPLFVSLTGCTTGDRYHQSTGEYLDDHSLTSNVKKALGDDPQFKYKDVDVTTFKGAVQLNGFANTREQKSRAGELARGAVGVKEVHNNITVKE